MKFETYTFKDLGQSVQQDIAAQVSAYTMGKLGEKPQMLPMTTDAIFAKHLGMAAFFDGYFAGYIAATVPIKHQNTNMPEVGSLWVPKPLRKLGIAHGLIQSITEELTNLGELPYAFCNPLSKPIFEQSGYSVTEDHQIPPEAFRECLACPAKPTGKGCCDNILIYTGEQI